MNKKLSSSLFVLIVASVVSVGLGAQPLIPAAPELAAKAWLLIDARTGSILAEHMADEQLPPASLTKMMTSYIVSEEIEAGRISEDDEALVSENAWRKGGTSSGGSTMFLPPNESAKIIDLMRGVIIQSGNDASIALAEHVAGSEEVFSDVMNQQAQRLGMRNTYFANSTGLPDPSHLTTARDLATLAKAIINDHPEHYEIYSEKSFEYNGISQNNRNRLLWQDASIDGLKTGYTDEAQYCLVASGERNGMRLISVVLGARSEGARSTESQKLLSWGFRYYITHQLYSAGEQLETQKLWKANQDTVSLGIAEDIYLTIPRGAEDLLDATMSVGSVLQAPLALGEEVGSAQITYQGEPIFDVPVVVTSEVEKAGFVNRIWDSIMLFFLGLFGRI